MRLVGESRAGKSYVMAWCEDYDLLEFVPFYLPVGKGRYMA
jgi:hypothetical protein